jgi:hypothetical protein
LKFIRRRKTVTHALTPYKKKVSKFNNCKKFYTSFSSESSIPPAERIFHWPPPGKETPVWPPLEKEALV